MVTETSDPVAHAIDLARRMRSAVEDTERELDSMPFFVRPMVRRGFARRTGRRFDDWYHALDALVLRLRAAQMGAQPLDRAASVEQPGLPGGLARLAEHYRTAPERAARGMGGNRAALDLVRARSRAREDLARALRDALDALPA